MPPGYVAISVLMVTSGTCYTLRGLPSLMRRALAPEHPPVLPCRLLPARGLYWSRARAREMRGCARAMRAMRAAESGMVDARDAVYARVQHQPACTRAFDRFPRALRRDSGEDGHLAGASSTSAAPRGSRLAPLCFASLQSGRARAVLWRLPPLLWLVSELLVRMPQSLGPHRACRGRP